MRYVLKNVTNLQLKAFQTSKIHKLLGRLLGPFVNIVSDRTHHIFRTNECRNSQSHELSVRSVPFTPHTLQIQTAVYGIWATRRIVSSKYSWLGKVLVIQSVNQSVSQSFFLWDWMEVSRRRMFEFDKSTGELLRALITRVWHVSERD